MSLSDRAVRRLLARHFVCAWTNLEGEALAGRSYAHATDDPAPSCLRGNGEHNVQILILTARGGIVHAMAGFIAPADLVAELTFALELLARLDGRQAAAQEEVVADAHRRAVAGREQQNGDDGPFASFIRSRVDADHRFVAEHPLLPVTDFRPAAMVGNAKTFFGSSRGSRPDGFIGDPAGAGDLDDLLRELRRRTGNEPR